MKNYIYFLLIVLCPVSILSTNCTGRTESGNKNAISGNKHGGENIFASKVVLTPVASGLTSPVAMAVAGDASGRIFICEQPGVIRVIDHGSLLLSPFLNITNKIDPLNYGYSEKGLLGLAFHPAYSSNGRFFIYYSAPSRLSESDHKSIVAEYHVSANNKNVADVHEEIIMEIEQPESNHNGGTLAFGPDGYLYIGLGDGGGAGDNHGTSGNGQNLSTWLGKILRIDVDKQKPYAVPPDNPFTGKNARPEIFAYGLRNPWKFSFDRKDGRLFCGDVGQNEFEEVDIINKGGNYGWRIMEGIHCYNSDNYDRVGLEYPIDEYPHSTGVSITGGYVYRGSYKLALGCYVYGDFNGKLFILSQGADEWVRSDLFIQQKNSNNTGIALNSFGEDETGELYIMGQRGSGPKNNTGILYKVSWVK